MSDGVEVKPAVAHGGTYVPAAYLQGRAQAAVLATKPLDGEKLMEQLHQANVLLDEALRQITGGMKNV